MTQQKIVSSKDRTSIISAVRTPLGFFVFVVLVVEGILGMLSGAIQQHRRTPHSLSTGGLCALGDFTANWVTTITADFNVVGQTKRSYC